MEKTCNAYVNAALLVQFLCLLLILHNNAHPAQKHVCSESCVLYSGALLLRLLDAYAVRYGEMLDGRSEQLPTSELAGGARIRHIFQDIFVEGVGQLNPAKYVLHALSCLWVGWQKILRCT